MEANKGSLIREALKKAGFNARQVILPLAMSEASMRLWTG